MTRRLTTEDFIEKAKKKHGDKYGYDEVDYKNARTKVEIFCVACDKYFPQRPGDHLRGVGCPTCGVKQSADSRRSTLEEFIKKAKEKHGDKYRYDKVVYDNNNTKVEIFCVACDEYFLQIPNNHLMGQGCPTCGVKRNGDSNRSTLEDFIEKAKEKHGDKYRYDKVVYQNARIKVEIFCVACDKYFPQIPDSHLRGMGCPTCGVKQCADNQRLSLEEFIKKAREKHGDKYRYDKVVYDNTYTKVEIFCVACDKYFLQTPRGHLMGQGCRTCTYKTEKMVFECLNKHHQSTKHNFSAPWCKNSDTGRYLPFDMCIRDLKIIIEVDGPQHFVVVKLWKSDPKSQRRRDLDKEGRAIENGYAVIRLVQEEVWDEKFDWRTALLGAIEATKPGDIRRISNAGLYDDWD